MRDRFGCYAIQSRSYAGQVRSYPGQLLSYAGQVRSYTGQVPMLCKIGSKQPLGDISLNL